LHGTTEESCSQLDSMVGKHEQLVQKLREECRHLVNELEQVTSKYKSVRPPLAWIYCKILGSGLSGSVRSNCFGWFMPPIAKGRQG